MAILLLTLSLAFGCSGSGSPETGSSETGGEDTANGSDGTNASTAPEPEKTQEARTTSREPLQVEQIVSDFDGLNRRQIMISGSAESLSSAAGIQVPGSGGGTYLAAFWGEKPTGGYTVEVLSARAEGVQITVRLALRKPPPDAMVSQALTYPYAVAVLRDVDPGEKEFIFVTENGREIGWPVRNV